MGLVGSEVQGLSQAPSFDDMNWHVVVILVLVLAFHHSSLSAFRPSDLLCAPISTQLHDLDMSDRVRGRARCNYASETTRSSSSSEQRPDPGTHGQAQTEFRFLSSASVVRAVDISILTTAVRLASPPI